MPPRKCPSPQVRQVIALRSTEATASPRWARGTGQPPPFLDFHYPWKGHGTVLRVKQIPALPDSPVVTKNG